MFSRAAVRAFRPAAVAARTPARATTVRSFSNSVRVSSGGHEPKIYGPGAKAGEVADAFEHTTGLERLQLLGDIEGVPVFPKDGLDASRLGTKADPIMVPSADPERLVGCTGFPADSHDTIWFPLTKDTIGRCIECGSVYALDYAGEAHHDEHAHGH